MDYTEFTVEELAADESFQMFVMYGRDQAFWDAWLQANPQKHELLNEAAQLVRLAQLSQQVLIPHQGRPAEIKRRLQAHIQAERTRVSQWQRWSAVFRVAAAVTLLMAFGWAIWRFSEQKVQEKAAPAIVSWVEKKALPGQKLTVRLSDGSTVKLNAGSSIWVSRTFDSLREVRLEGEAFFEIAHDPSRPFHIRSKDVVTQVLGTSFNVRANPEEPTVSVAVVTGKVLVANASAAAQQSDKNSHQQAVLTPNQMAVCLDNGNGIVTTGYDPAKVLAWRDGILLLDNDDFPTSVRKMEKWYGVTFHLEDSVLVTERYKGSFKNESLENVLEALKVSGRFSYRIEGKEVYIQ